MDVVGELLADADAGASVVTVVTADRELVERVEMLGATTLGPSSFLKLLDPVEA